MLETTERQNGTRRVQSVPVGVSKTEQAHRSTVNINKIVAKARKGVPVRINKGTGLYGDFSSGMDYQSAMEAIADAQLDFMSLPSNVRERFSNDVGKLLDFISDPGNEDEARELGLLPEKAPEAPETPEAPGEPEAPESPQGGDGS